jgi:hypothetical protein
MRLEINDEEVRVVRLIFQWYTVYAGTAEIIRRLAAEGIPAPGSYKVAPGRKRGLHDWAQVTVYKILADTAYIGRYTFYKSPTIL